MQEDGIDFGNTQGNTHEKQQLRNPSKRSVRRSSRWFARPPPEMQVSSVCKAAWEWLAPVCPNVWTCGQPKTLASEPQDLISICLESNSVSMSKQPVMGDIGKDEEMAVQVLQW